VGCRQQSEGIKHANLALAQELRWRGAFQKHTRSGHFQALLSKRRKPYLKMSLRCEYIPVDSDAAATASAPNYDTSCLSSRRLWPASMPHTVSEGQPSTRFERDSEIGTPENRANLGGAGSWANSEVTASAGQYGFQKPYDSGTNHPSLQGCIYGGFLKAILPS